MDRPSILVENLFKNYGQTRALDGVDLKINPGEMFGLLGPNGSGKTTLLKILCSVLDYTSGNVEVSGLNVLRDSMQIRKIIGYVPETPVLYESLTASEYLDFIGWIRRIDHESIEKKKDRFARAFEIEDKMDTFVGSLSFGTKQKVAIISSLLHDPPLIIMDEAMNGLDPRSARILKDLLSEYASRGRTIIFSTHILEVAESLCSRLAIIYRGNIVDSGTPGDLKSRSGGRKLEDIFLEATNSNDLNMVVNSLKETILQ